MPKYPFNPEVLDALPEELAELYRGIEDTLLEEICSRLKAADQFNEVTVQDIRALRAHGIDLKKIEKAIRQTSGISEKKLKKLLDDVVERNQKYYTEMISSAHHAAGNAGGRRYGGYDQAANAGYIPKLDGLHGIFGRRRAHDAPTGQSVPMGAR